VGVEFLFERNGSVESDNGKYKIEEEGNEDGTLEGSFFSKCAIDYSKTIFFVFSPTDIEPTEVIAHESQ